MIYRDFHARLAAALDAASDTLPLTAGDEARLLDILPSGEEILLVLCDGLWKEQIKVSRTGDFLLVTGRRLEGEEPRVFPKGSAIAFEVTVAVVRRLAADHHSDTLPAEVSTVVVPDGKVGEPWQGVVVFLGGRVKVSVCPLPDWVFAEEFPGHVAFSGTPPEAGTFSFAVAASNGTGYPAIATLTVQVTN